jgi:hypothetical protein
MKTPMQNFIDWLDEYYQDPSGYTKQAVASKMYQFLIDERTEILDAFNFGGEYDDKWKQIAIQYYEERFGKHAVKDVCPVCQSESQVHGACNFLINETGDEMLCLCGSNCREKCLNSK